MLEQIGGMQSTKSKLSKRHGKTVRTRPPTHHVLADEVVVHAADIPYVWGPSLTPEIPIGPLDIALSLQVQKAWISFAATLDPNSLGDLAPGVRWPRYQEHSQNILVFQRTDGSGEQANGTLGTPVGQGLHEEKDPDDRPFCEFYAANDAAFVH